MKTTEQHVVADALGITRQWVIKTEKKVTEKLQAIYPIGRELGFTDRETTLVMLALLKGEDPQSLDDCKLEVSRD